MMLSEITEVQSVNLRCEKMTIAKQNHLTKTDVGAHRLFLELLMVMPLILTCCMLYAEVKEQTILKVAKNERW